MHGHQVGGTNPSLVEALGAGNAVIAHDNRFNRWTAGKSQLYFTDVESCETCLDLLISGGKRLVDARNSARQRHCELFEWSKILSEYEDLLTSVAAGKK